jgi:hypothetical protein
VTPQLTSEALKTLLEYDPETGQFARKMARGRRPYSGHAGSVNSDGYVQIFLMGRIHKAHRLAWLYVYGEWPSGQIDHIDGVRTNNRISNLRVATNQQNSANRRRAKNNTSGFKGVSRYASMAKWHAQIWVNGRPINLGFFDDIDNARDAYASAALKYFGQFARTA